MPQVEIPRPFFSIIIPCYNSRNTIIPLLESIVNQHLDYYDIEVILSDDCSTESYQDAVDFYKNKLYIKQVKTDYNCCPGNTRQKGAENATGEWLMFIDHDDELVENSLATVKKDILQINCNTLYFSRFYKKTLQGQYVEMPNNAGWTHGRFYNLDNLWKKYNLHYIKDLASHQDISLTTQIEYIRKVYDIPCYENPKLFTYVWKQSSESLSNRSYQAQGRQRPFIDVFFVDYVKSTAGVCWDLYLKNNKLGADYVEKTLKDVLLYSYYYLEFAVYVNPEYLKENFDEVYKYLQILKTEFNVSIDDIFNFFKVEDIQDRRTIINMAMQQTDYLVCEKGFKQWLTDIWEKKY